MPSQPIQTQALFMFQADSTRGKAKARARAKKEQEQEQEQERKQGKEHKKEQGCFLLSSFTKYIKKKIDFF